MITSYSIKLDLVICFSEVFDKIRKQKRRLQQIIFHHNDAYYHRRTVIILKDNSFKWVAYCPYTTQLSRNNFFLFSFLKLN